MMSGALVLSTWSFGRIANRAAWPVLERDGTALDAVEAGCRAVEADPQVRTVGYGGLPDRSGQVSLDGSIMQSPAACGSVCYVRRFAHPVSIARAVMEKTQHVMLAGEGADRFAEALGMQPNELLTERSAASWRRWKAANPVAAADPTVRYTPQPNVEEAERREASAGEEAHDTVGVLALDKHGALAGACSTSGLPYKVPGRVGDSPIIGHGLYVDPEAGAAVATGDGELMMRTCASFLAVERMRSGASPEEAGLAALERIQHACQPGPQQQVGMILLAPDGQWSGVALRTGYVTALRDARRDEFHEPIRPAGGSSD